MEAKTEDKVIAKSVFLNPFNKGVSYAEFLASIPKGKTIEEYCNKQITKEELEFLIEDLKHLKK